MRRLALLLPLAVVVIAAALWGTYRIKVRKLRREAPTPPPILETTLTSSSLNFEWGQNKDGKPQVQIKAKHVRYLKDSSKMELEEVELRLYQKDAQHYDLVKSPRAVFSQSDSKMFSDGEVEVTLDVPVDGKLTHQLTSIKSTGITFDSKTGKAETDKPASFTFENGNGTCVGVSYDPDVHEMHMNDKVDIYLTGKGKRSKTMHVQTEKLVYQEAAGKVFLGPWSKLARENTVVDAAGAIINLKDKQIDTIDADRAHGVDSYPKRHLSYAADALHVTYNDDGELEKMTGTGHAWVTSESKGSPTTVKANTVDMFFETKDNENVLRRTIANGDASIEAKPEPSPDGKIAETKVLHSQLIELKMRPGGRELEEVDSHVPTSLELIPNQPAQHHRVLHGADMIIVYGPQNVIQSFRSTKVTTDTDPLPPKPGQKANLPTLAVSHTVSDNMSAEFDQKSGEMKRMKQWGHFTYEEGERHGIGETAFFEHDSNIMDIDQNARVWDANGSTSADHIKMNQNTGDFDANGHVTTTRQADPKKAASAMLDDTQPSQGSADHVWSGNKNHLVHYEGHALVWQTANRTQADKIDIDRDKKILVAAGNVISEFIDQDNNDSKSDDKQQTPAPNTPPKAVVFGPQPVLVAASRPLVAGDPLSGLPAPAIAPAKPPAPPQPPPAPKAVIYTVVHAQKLVYTDQARLADYTGSVVMTRPNMTIKGNTMQAFLNPKDSGEDSKLNHMVADGNVEIFDKGLDRTRTSNGDHGEYYTADSRVVIAGTNGHTAKMVDSKKGDINEALKMTYWSDDDKLQVDGVPKKRIESHLHRKQ